MMEPATNSPPQDPPKDAPARLTVIALVLLGLTVALWTVVVIDMLGLAYVYVYVMRFPNRAIGPWLTYAYFSLFPLIAVILGLRLSRVYGRRISGRFIAVAGTLLFLMELLMIGAILHDKFVKWHPSKNPSTPRPIEPMTGLPVFPGAEGFGTRTKAGRGGKLIEVTSLADSGPGTLRAALEEPNPRIIVFRVGGTIELVNHLIISQPFVTVAGQTAPGGGICLKNAGLAIFTHDVLVQHLRIRPGNEGTTNAENNDAIQILGGSGDPTYNIVLDHVSAGWGEDENVSAWFGAHDITISWSIISEALNSDRHPKGGHSAGLLLGDSSYHVSVHHSLLAHNSFRTPLIIEGGTHDFVNNVIYNWNDTSGEIYEYDSNTFLNFIGNFYRPGPSTKKVRQPLVINTTNPKAPGPKIFVEDNLGPTRLDAKTPDWAFVTYTWVGKPAPEQFQARTRFPTPPVTTWPATEAFDKVLAGAGATKPRRDAVDSRVVQETKAGTGMIIDSPQHVGGYPPLDRGTPPVDSDHDGMPDEWEKEKKLDPKDPQDGNKDRDGDAYTNIEEYLFSLLSDASQKR